MASSQNGWRANDRSVITTMTVPGTRVRLAVRRGAPGQLLIAAAARWHREVEPLVVGTCWGYAERPIRGGTQLSNHASGTAADINAPQHPLATEPSANFSRSEIAAVRDIVGDTGDVLRWGGNYRGRKDGMHIEINDGRSEADCDRALERIGGSSPGASASSSSVLRRGSKGPAVATLQRVLAAWYPHLRLVVDGDFGPATEAAVVHLQRTALLTVDGIAGPQTMRVLHI